MTDIATKLDEARALIEKGWTQAQYWDGDGSVCSIGAMSLAAHGDPSFGEWHAFEFIDYNMHALLGRAAGVAPTALAEWNDAPERAQAEVVEAFRKAAKLARGENPVVPVGRHD